MLSADLKVGIAFSQLVNLMQELLFSLQGAQTYLFELLAIGEFGLAELFFVVFLDKVNRLFKLDHLFSETLLDKSILLFLFFHLDYE